MHVKRSSVVAAAALLVLMPVYSPGAAQRGDFPDDGRDVRADVAAVDVHGPFVVTARDMEKGGGGPRVVAKRRALAGEDDLELTWADASDCPVGTDCRRFGPAEGIAFRSPALTTGPYEVTAIGATDPQIAASATHLVVTAFNELAIYTKDGTLLKSMSTEDLFKPLWDPANPDNYNTNLNLPEGLACDATKDPSDPTADRTYCIDALFDARVVFDEYRQRFWIGTLTRNSATKKWHTDADGNLEAIQPAVIAARRNKALLAVSVSANPMDGWYLFWWDAVIGDGACNDPTFDSCPNSEYRPGDVADYPSLGISEQFFTMTATVSWRDPDGSFQDADGNWTLKQDPHYAVAFVFQANGLAGTAPCAGPCGWAWWNLQDPGSPGKIVYGGIQPAVHHGNVPNDLAAWVMTTPSQRLNVWTFSANNGLFAPALHAMSWSTADWASQVIVNGGHASVPWSNPTDAPQPLAGNVTNPKRMRLGNLANIALKVSGFESDLVVTLQDCVAWESWQDECSTSIRVITLDALQAWVTNTTTVRVDRTFGLRNIDDGPNDVVYYGNPAVEINHARDIVAVYSRAGKTVFPEARYTTLLSGESDVRPSSVLHAGTFPVSGNIDSKAYAGNLDTGGISLDPFDQTGIWMVHAYALPEDSNNDKGKYQLAIGKVLGRSYPDLVVTELRRASGTHIGTGSTIQLDVSAANQGDGLASAVRVQIYLSADNLLSSSDPVLADIQLGALTPGDSAGVTGYSVTIPPNTESGWYTLFAVVDPLAAIVEYSETNNRRTAPLRVGSGAP